MAIGQFASLLHHIRRLIGRDQVNGQTDGDLLKLFGTGQDQEAFTVLVRRHGPMVLGVCRRVLRDDHTAEDVFQAVFLILARKAKALHQYGSLGNWLYTVTHRLALKTRAQRERQRVREQQGVDVPASAVTTTEAWSELRPVLDAELDRLPATYRTAVVLCYLEGKTNEEAARELGWPVGTVKVRLSRARDLLRTRLIRRGLTGASALLAPDLAEHACAALPPALLTATTEAASRFAAGGTLAAGATPAVHLAQGALQTMFMRKLQTTLALLVALGLLGTGAGAYLGTSPAPAAPPAAAAESTAAEAAPAPSAPAAEAGKADKSAPGGNRSRRVHKQLNQAVEIEFKPNTPLKEALDLLSEKYKVTIVIDRKAFEAIGINKVEEMPVDLPKMTDVRLSAVLNKLLKQVQGDNYHGTFQVRPGYLEVTSWYNQMAEAAAESPDHPALRGGGGVEALVPRELSGDPTRKLTPVVHIDADQRPLADVLRDLADDAEVDIIIDRRAADKARTPVDLTINNALLDTAVSLLVDAADMDWMWIDNVVFVGSKEDIKVRKERKKAAEQERIKQMREARDLETPGSPFSPGVAPPPPVKPTRPGGPPPAM